jgi:hypothetical protein
MVRRFQRGRCLLLMAQCLEEFGRQSRRQRQLSFMLFPQGLSGHTGQVIKRNPYVASGRTSEVYSTRNLQFLRQVGLDLVRVEYSSITTISGESLA